MFIKSQVLSLVSLVALPLAVNAQCNMEFYSDSGCSGSPVASCIPADTEPYDYCLWNTWVGSIYYSGCNNNEFPVFVGCDGVPYNNVIGGSPCPAESWTISIGNGYNSGCVDIGTYDGYATTSQMDTATCMDCVGA